MDIITLLDDQEKQRRLPQKLIALLKKFYISYIAALKGSNFKESDYTPLFTQYLSLILKQAENPSSFQLYHKRVRSPFDYYQFGLDFIRPLIIMEKSRILRLENVDRMEAMLAKGENIVLLANHQTEPDPQAINILLEKTHPKFAEKMIFVAGHRVISDPLAIPLSMGCNLLCIFSKRHIETPPEQKAEKLAHNQKTMRQLSQLLGEGGKCIYVAPSGGRDRADAAGKVTVAPFDPQSIEMFWFLSQQVKPKTHFYPLALATYDLLPPPCSVEKELGEPRHAQRTPIHLAFGNEINMEEYPGKELSDKKERRIKRAEHIWDLVCQDYAALTQEIPPNAE